MTDKEMLRNLWEGEPQGLEELIRHYGGYVSTIVWRILCTSMSVQDAEEVVSDVFLAAWDHRNHLQEGKIKAWLGTVARNKAKNKLRTRRHTLPLEEEILEVQIDPTLEDRERSALVRHAVDSLGEPDREIFLRHYFYIEKVSRIAQTLGMSETAVKSRLRRGRMKLKSVLERWDVV